LLGDVLKRWIKTPWWRVMASQKGFYGVFLWWEIHNQRPESTLVEPCVMPFDSSMDQDSRDYVQNILEHKRIEGIFETWPLLICYHGVLTKGVTFVNDKKSYILCVMKDTCMVMSQSGQVEMYLERPRVEKTSNYGMLYDKLGQFFSLFDPREYDL
jgi:hypothetical protein